MGKDNSAPKIARSVTAKVKKRKKKINSRRIVDRLVYSHTSKTKIVREKRAQIKAKHTTASQEGDNSETVQTIRFGSLNVNGLGTEASWAVTELLDEKKLDVCLIN